MLTAVGSRKQVEKIKASYSSHGSISQEGQKDHTIITSSRTYIYKRAPVQDEEKNRYQYAYRDEFAILAPSVN